MALVGQSTEAALVRAGTNGTRVTWRGADQVSITLENGLLVATRGFAQDLRAANVSGGDSGAGEKRWNSGASDGISRRIGPNFDASVAVQHRFWWC